MPRLATSLLRHAYNADPLLSLLLRECRDLPSARNELRWLSEHVSKTSKAPTASTLSGKAASQLRRLCLDRSRGKPLQYILGTQPFGDLEILCKKDVLIPRPDTEAYTTVLARTLVDYAKTTPLPRLRILDICTGTGCIALLLQSMLSAHIADLSVKGVDISSKALALAKQNLRWNITQGHLVREAQEQVDFVHGDVLNNQLLVDGEWDILISNPPYISPQSFDKDTARSVRNHEPKLALVPQRPRRGTGPGLPPNQAVRDPGDIFYEPLLMLAERVNAKVVVLEIADSTQADRVLQLVRNSTSRFWDGHDLWYDDIEASIYEGRAMDNNQGDGSSFRNSRLGPRNARAVVCWRQEGRNWLGRHHCAETQIKHLQGAAKPHMD